MVKITTQSRSPSPEVAHARARKARAVRYHGPDHPRTHEADRDLREVKLAEHIARVVDAAPALTDQQRARLAALLQPSGGGDSA